MRKIIESYPNYSVDSEGRIFNNETGKEKAQYVNRDGYKVVDMYKNNKPTRKTVHRFVALAFIPNPENKPCVNHLDGNKENNKVENLEWATYSENTIHAFETGLLVREKGEKVHNAIFSDEEIHQVCRMMQAGYRNIDIQSKLNVPKYLLKNIRNNGAWSHISCQYNIPEKSRTLSEETIRWICEKMEQGYQNKEILEMSTNQKITKSILTKIRCFKMYVDIRKEYNF